MIFNERRIAKDITANGGFVNFSRLNPLRIRGAIVTRACDLCLLATCDGVRDIDARGLNLTDDMLSSHLCKFSSLRSILLNDNQVAAKTVKALSAATHLSFVSLIGTAISEEDVNSLRIAKPECVVICEIEELFSGVA